MSGNIFDGVLVRLMEKTMEQESILSFKQNKSREGAKVSWHLFLHQ